MGEIADMMLNGTLCSCCGVFLGEISEDDTDKDDVFIPSGYPERCKGCR